MSTVRTEAIMGTLVTIHVVRPGAEAAIERAFDWFYEIERVCTRFDPASELSQLMEKAGEAVAVSTILFEVVQFALTIAAETGGAFDPTLGGWRDVQLDREHRTIALRRPLRLDLGAVAKGMAVDTAARELAPFSDFAIDAGGDLYLAGCNPQGEPWSVGIRHPRLDGELIDSLRVSGEAVCTSGDYEQPSHILDPATHTPASAVASATVVAPSAMLADALATAAFVLGPVAGIDLLDRMGAQGLLITPNLERYETGGLRRAA